MNGKIKFHFKLYVKYSGITLQKNRHSGVSSSMAGFPKMTVIP